MRIVFMGSPGQAVPSLEQLIINNYEMAAVYTQPDRPAGRGRGVAASAIKEAALRWGLKVEQPESLRYPKVLATLRNYKPELIVICAYGQILPQELLDIRQCVNVHFSLLPRHRGASPVAAAILAGDEFSGVSIQLVRKKLDTGPILAKAAVPILSGDNTGSLAEKIAIVGARVLNDALLGWERGEIKPVEQNEAEANYFGQIKKEDGEIDWRKPAVNIWREVRAYYPWPGSFTRWQGKQLKINEATVLTSIGDKEPGRVIALENGGFGISTGNGVLVVLNVQYEGKKAMPAAEYLRGQRNFIGSRLPE